MSAEPKKEEPPPQEDTGEVLSLPADPVPTQTSLRSIAPKRSWKEKLAWTLNIQFLAILLIPIFFIWILFVFKEPKYKGLFVLLVVGFYFATGCMPLPGVALVPIVFMPLLMIKDSKKNSEEYMRNQTMMSFATILLALSAVSSGLSQRAAIKILGLSGADFRKSQFLSVSLAVLLSMWFPNTAVMMFMMDVMDKVISEMKDAVVVGSLGDNQINAEEEAKKKFRKSVAISASPTVASTTVTKRRKTLELEENYPSETEMEKDETNTKTVGTDTTKSSIKASPGKNAIEENDRILDLYKMSVLHAIGVASNIGSLLWPYCSTSAIILILKKDVTFDIGVWQTFTFPLIVVMIPITIGYLDLFTFRLPSWIANYRKPPHPLQKSLPTFLDLEVSSTARSSLQEYFKEKGSDLGKFTSHEKGVMIMLTCTAQLFFWTDPGFIAGWSSPLKVDVKVSTIATIAAILSFVIPKCGSDMFRGPTKPKEKSSFTALLQWKIVQSSFPWGLIIFIGGSTALAVGINKSEFSKHVADRLGDSMNGWNKESVLLVSMFLAFTLAFFITNTAAAYIMIEIMKGVSTKLKISQCYLTIPCVAVTSLAFILPAGTPTLALLQIRTHKMHAFRCLRLGVPLAFFLFFIVYMFAISIVGYMVPCKIY